MFSKKKKEVKEEDIAKLRKSIAEERERLRLRKTAEQLKREKFKLEHPVLAKTAMTAKTSSKNVARLVETIARQRARKTARRARYRPKVARTRAIPMATMRNYRSPSGDISLSGAIAQETWYGNENFATRDFFGEHEEREFIKDRNPDINIGGNFNKDFFGSKARDMNNLVDTNKNVNIDIFGGKGKNKRFI